MARGAWLALAAALAPWAPSAWAAAAAVEEACTAEPPGVRSSSMLQWVRTPLTAMPAELLEDDASEMRGHRAMNVGTQKVMQFRLTMVNASGLRRQDWGDQGTSDPYCVCQIPGKPETKIRTQTIEDTESPNWMHEAEMAYTAGDKLECRVYDEDEGSADRLLGKTTLRSSTFYPQGFVGEVKLRKGGGNAFLKLKIEELSTLATPTPASPTPAPPTSAPPTPAPPTPAPPTPAPPTPAPPAPAPPTPAPPTPAPSTPEPPTQALRRIGESIKDSLESIAGDIAEIKEAVLRIEEAKMAPTPLPAPAPTSSPSPAPTEAPTPAPTTAPTPAPTPAPTTAPTPHTLYIRIHADKGDRAVCFENARIPLPCGNCGPGWGPRERCEAECDAHHDCHFMTFFSDNGCRIYSACETAWNHNWDVESYIYEKAPPNTKETERFRISAGCFQEEIITTSDVCAYAAKALGLPDTSATEVPIGSDETGGGCRYADGELRFAKVDPSHLAVLCTGESLCLCNVVQAVGLSKKGGAPLKEDNLRPEFVRMSRCDAATGRCMDVSTNPIVLERPWTKAVWASDFECPMKGLVQIHIVWSWRRVKGNMSEFKSPNDRPVTGIVVVNGVRGHPAPFAPDMEGTRIWATRNMGSGILADGNILSIKSEVVKPSHAPEGSSEDVDEFTCDAAVVMASAHLACEDAKVCIKILAQNDTLRVQLQCLEGKLQSDVCQQWRQCLTKSGAEHQLLILLRAAVLHPDNITAGDDEAQDLAGISATDEDSCIHPATMDTEAWYCLCIDEMQKACREISRNIGRYDESKCFQANGCFDPFNRVCPSWKQERRRCRKLKVYTDELEKHQRASLLQRANRSANGAAGDVARLDGTVGSKAHQCNH